MEKVLVLFAIGFILFPIIQSLENHIKTWQFGSDYSSNTLIRIIKGMVPPSQPSNINLDLPRCFTPTYVTLTLVNVNPTSTVFYNNGSSSFYVFCSFELYCKFRIVVKGIKNPWIKCSDNKKSPKNCNTPDCQVGRSQDHEKSNCITVTDCQEPPLKSPFVEKPCVGLNCQPKIPIPALESILKSAPILNTQLNTKSNNVPCTIPGCRTYATDRGFVPIINFLASPSATTLLNSKRLRLNDVKPIINYLTLNSDEPNTSHIIKSNNLGHTFLSDKYKSPRKCKIEVSCDQARVGYVQQQINKKPCLSPNCASELVYWLEQINQENPVDLTRYIAQSVEHGDEEYDDYLIETQLDNYKHDSSPEDVFDKINFSDDYINNLEAIHKALHVDDENRGGGHDNDSNNYPIQEVTDNLPLLNTNDIIIN